MVPLKRFTHKSIAKGNAWRNISRYLFAVFCFKHNSISLRSLDRLKIRLFAWVFCSHWNTLPALKFRRVAVPCERCVRSNFYSRSKSRSVPSESWNLSSCHRSGFLFFFFFLFLSFFLSFFFCFCLINGIQKTDILKSGLVRNHSLDGTVEIRFTMPLPALMVWRKTTCFFLNFRHFSNVLEGYDILLQTPLSTLSIKSKYKSEWRRASVNSDQNVRAG